MATYTTLRITVGHTALAKFGDSIVLMEVTGSEVLTGLCGCAWILHDILTKYSLVIAIHVDFKFQIVKCIRSAIHIVGRLLTYETLFIGIFFLVPHVFLCSHVVVCLLRWHQGAYAQQQDYGDHKNRVQASISSERHDKWRNKVSNVAQGLNGS